VEVNPTTVEVESTTLDIKLTVVEDDSVVEEFDLWVVWLTTTTSHATGKAATTYHTCKTRVWLSI
jgi:hypothetical protein